MTAFSSRPQTAFGVALCGLVIANVWLGWTSWSQWEQAQAAWAQERHLERLAQKIEVLRDRPVQIEEGLRTSDALARLVETSARQVGLNPEQIVRIDPGDPRRIEQTPYLEQRTNVELREIPLRKLVEFSMALEHSGMGMLVSSLSTRVPPGVDSAEILEELWNAQLLLTGRIYADNVPPSPPSPSR